MVNLLMVRYEFWEVSLLCSLGASTKHLQGNFCFVNLGFRGVTLDWFKSYLSNRKQFVRYQMHDSNHKIINCGVPQGSILGPLLFILYINDVVNTPSLFEVILFVDDTTLLFSHPDIASQNDIINIELQEICNWFQADKLFVNATKTNYRCTELLRVQGYSLI